MVDFRLIGLIETEPHLMWRAQVQVSCACQPPLTCPRAGSSGGHFASRRCSSPSEPCSPPAGCRPALLPPPRRYTSPGRCRRASSQLPSGSLSGLSALLGVKSEVSVMPRLALPLYYSLCASLSGLRCVRGFYRSPVAIFDPCTQCTISVL